MSINIGSVFISILPAYIANAVPVLFGGGKTIDELIGINGLFGKNKTLRGFVFGVMGGSLFFFLPMIAFDMSMPNALFISILESLGAMVGDLLGSFVKRRFNIKEGAPFVLDSFLFIIVAMLFAFPLWKFMDIFSFFLITIITPILHKVANVFANVVGLKKVPW